MILRVVGFALVVMVVFAFVILAKDILNIWRNIIKDTHWFSKIGIGIVVVILSLCWIISMAVAITFLILIVKGGI